VSRALLILANQSIKAKAILWIDKAPWNTRVEFKAPRRSLPQNDRMHAMLTEIATQHLYHGIRLHKDDWKLLFLDQIKRELKQDMRLVPNLDGTGIVPLGRSSSDLAKEEMSGMIELIFKYGAENGVVFHEPITQTSSVAA
jgi:hypothetical protein